MTEKLSKAINEFITQRINDLGMDSPDPVTEAITNVSISFETLESALNEEQHKLLAALENAISLQVGEETRYYYKAGFYDAIHFLMGWTKE